MARRKRKSSTDWVSIGHYAFFIGALVAVVAGLFRNVIPDVVLVSVLVLLGLVVGLLNVTMRETTEFLVAAIALMLAGVVNLGIIPVVGLYVRSILTNLVVFVVPAAIIVSLRAIWVLAARR